MGRPERRLDPAADPVQALARDLRELRKSAGAPTYEELAKRTESGPLPRRSKVLSAAAAGTQCPSWDTLEAYVLACDGRPAMWRTRWAAARNWQTKPIVDSPAGLNNPSPQDLTALASEACLVGESPKPSGREWPHEVASTHDVPFASAGPHPYQAERSSSSTKPAQGSRRRHMRIGVVVGLVIALALASYVGGVGLPRYIGGTVTCANGENVTGVWVKAGAGRSGFAKWLPTDSSAVATFDYQLSRRAAWTVSVGCGWNNSRLEAAIFWYQVHLR